MSSMIEKAPRHRYFATLAVVLGVVLGLGGVEVVSRILGLARPRLSNELYAFVPDAMLPWIREPGSVLEGISRTGEFHFHYKHNSLGFRGRDHEIEKEPGVFRIVGIGDSFTYGVGASAGATFLARIEATLSARGGGEVEAINLGMPRYWPEPEALVLEHYGLRYKPDLVIVGVMLGDLADTRLGAAYASVSDGYLVTSRVRHLGAVGRWFYLNSYAARPVILRLLTWPPRRERGLAWHAEGPIEPGMEDDADVWARIHWAHDRMVGLARAAGARIAFVHIPQKGPWGKSSFEMPTRLRNFCAVRECSVIDVLPAAMSHPNPSELYYPKDGHCTEAGYALVADVIVRELESQGLLPDKLRSDKAAVTNVHTGN